MAKHPYTENQFKVLAAAFHDKGCTTIATRRARSRATNDMRDAGLIYDGFMGGALTPAGLLAYVDMCERYDADSGCLAFAERAGEARAVLAGCQQVQA